jgi:hypothetical protein
VFVEQENIVCTLKWPRVIAKNGKIFVLRRKKFGRIDSCTTFTIVVLNTQHADRTWPANSVYAVCISIKKPVLVLLMSII